MYDGNLSRDCRRMGSQYWRRLKNALQFFTDVKLVFLVKYEIILVLLTCQESIKIIIVIQLSLSRW